MLVYLDSNIVIYLIEQPAAWGPRASLHVAGLLANGNQIAVSDLTRLECRIHPLAANDTITLAQYDAFFASPDVHIVPLSAAVYDRAALIRARHGFKLGDAIHLAAAVESGCPILLTNDTRLSRFFDLAVVELS